MERMCREAIAMGIEMERNVHFEVTLVSGMLLGKDSKRSDVRYLL